MRAKRESHDDWYSKASALKEQHARLPTGSAFGDAASQKRRDSAADLSRIREIVRGVVRAHGVPRNCRIDFARLGEEGSGCAGFEDAPDSFERPFVLLDKSIYDDVDRSVVVAVYCGLGLHEAGHVLHTREGYRRLAAGVSKLRSVYENLWEDERIEDLVRVASPGFAGYLCKTKEVLLEQGEPGKVLENWAALADMDLVNAMIFAFIRLPHRIPAELKLWKAVNKECLFETLRSLFPNGPTTETDVAELSERLEQLWLRLRQLYPSTPDDARRLTSRPGTPTEELRRIAEQLAADIEDRACLGTNAFDADERVGTGNSPDNGNVADSILDAAIEIDELARAQKVW